MSPGQYGATDIEICMSENGLGHLEDVTSRKTAASTEKASAAYLLSTRLGATPLGSMTVSRSSVLSTDSEIMVTWKSRIPLCGRNKKSRLLIVLMGSATFFHMMTYSLLAPFFPQEARIKELTSTVTGLIFSCFMFVYFFISLVYGSNLSSIGVNFMVSTGLSVGGVCAILFGTLQYCPKGQAFIALCFLTRMTEALGLAAFSTASFAVISSQFTDTVTTVFGSLESAKSVGFMLGPAFGGFLYNIGGFGLPFFVIGSCVVLNGLLLLVFLPKTDHKDIVSKKDCKSKLSLLASSQICLVLSCVFISCLSIGFLDSTLALRMEHLGIPTQWIGLVFSMWGVVYCCTTPFTGWLCDRKNMAVPELILGHLLSSVAYFFIGSCPLLYLLPDTLWPGLLGLCMVSVAEACIGVSSMSCMVEAARSLGFSDDLELYGILSGLYQSAYSLGAFMGPFFGGLLIEKISFRNAAGVFSCLFLLKAFVLMAYFGRKKTHKSTNVKH